ncbi:uncharacterized protein LOC143220649, partial [Lasioglossum baleicum]|uniref:uncharacterized protein LOC143220649 n=1 Tax=Lasioglossum baleicum TaxID=434251 RepID=UPI003FCECBB3
MEKFAIDLDKVLDDFEFNEDCAEQIASVNPSTNNASSSSVKCNLESSALKTYNYLLIEPKKANTEFDIILPVERHKDLQQIDTKIKCVSEKDTISENLNYNTEESTIENTDVNQFYTQECTNDNKSIQKQSVPSYDSEQVPLAIYNDISQKLMQKQQNTSSSPKIDNRYDKKLNQFNLKPSVSNVFSSLNEYINAPPGSSDCIHSVLDDPEIQPNIEAKTIYHVNEVPQLIQSTAKDSDKNVMLKQTTDITDSIREVSIPSHEDVAVPITLTELPITSETSIKEDVNDIQVTNFKTLESETELSKDVTTNEACTELSDEAEITNDKTNNYNFDNMDQENNSMLECTYTQDNYYENESTIQLQNSDKKLSMENINTVDKYENSIKPAHKPIGFSNIDNLSEDELTKYLTELEEEEKLRESCNKHENIANTTQNISQDEKNENIQNVQIFTDPVVESSNVIESELNEKAETIFVSGYKNEETDEELLDNTLEKQNVQHQDDQLNDDKHRDILNNQSNKELKLLHAANITQDDKVKLENECVPNAKNTKDSQENSMYSLNINQGSLSSSKTEIQLKEQKTSCTQYSQACELKMPSEIDSISEQRTSVTPEVKILNDKTKDNDDVIPTSMEVYTRPNVSDISDLEKPVRPQTLDIVLTNNSNEHQALSSINDTPSYQVQSDADGTKEEQGSSPDILENSLPESSLVLGKQPPFWVPDSDAPSCMLCDVKFTVLKRRHHCRACGKVLCNKCCNMKYKLEYQGNIDSRVCVSCYQLLTKAETEQGVGEWFSDYSMCVNNNDINSPQGRQPNPNNPMEYCSTIPPLQQLAGGLPPPPTVMVPVGVLKREDGTKSRPEISKSVMFSDGIRPGCDLTELDMSWDLKPPYRKSGNKRISTPGTSVPSTSVKKQNLPRLDPNTDSYVPQDPNALPPTVTIHKG